MTKTYTLPELLALPDDALNPLAAELRGWRLSTAGIFWRNAVGEVICHRGHFTPATDRNQSGELIIWALDRDVEFVNTRTDDLPMQQIINARTETVAFCAAMLAMQGRLSDG